MSIVIPLSQGLYALVDSCDSDLANVKWYARNNYAARRLPSLKNEKQKHQLMHRLILARILNRELLSSEQVDHINLNKSDNRRANLRLANRAENCRNIPIPRHNTSGFKGVSWCKANGKWRAQIYLMGKQIHLGYFYDAEEAYAMYCIAAKQYHGEFARFK